MLHNYLEDLGECVLEDTAAATAATADTLVFKRRNFQREHKR